MKKIITLSLLAIFSLGMNAQTTILDFEDEEVTSGKITMTVQNEAYLTDLYAENPDKEGLNTSDRCAHFCNTVSYVWWHGFYFAFNQNIEASGNKYLHMMMKKDIVEASNVSITLVNADGTQSTASATDSTTIFYPITTEWVDYVMEIPSGWETISGIFVKFNSAVGTNCYFDDLYMDNDPTPRTVETEGENEDDDVVVEPIVPVTDQNILDYEDEAVTSERITMNVQSASYLTDLYTENPDKEGANTSDICASFCSPDTTPTWWHGFYFTFNQTVDTNGYQYLHMMMKKSAEETTNAVINLLNTDGSQSTASADDATTIYQPITTEWVDYVMTIPTGWETISGMYVKFNAAMGTTCYFDQLYMDNDPTPRTSLAGVDGIEASTVAKSIVCVNGKTITTTASQSMQVYNLLGGLVYEGEGSYEAKTAGIYVVRVNGTAQKVAVK